MIDLDDDALAFATDPWPPVLLLVGVDGRTYRRLDRGALNRLSHGRGFHVDRSLLSPDGTRLAGDGGYTIDLPAVRPGGAEPVVLATRRRGQSAGVRVRGGFGTG